MSQDWFARQKLVWGDERLKALQAAHVTVLGLGGLGCMVCEQLVRSGIGELTIVDTGRVAESDLGRQVLYGMSDMGRAKTMAARDRLTNIRPDVRVNAVQEDVAAFAARGWGSSSGVVDCLNTFAARFATEKYLPYGMFWVHGGLHSDHGQILTIEGGSGHRLQNILRGARDTGEAIPVIPQTCAVVGSMQALTTAYNIWLEEGLLQEHEMTAALRDDILFIDLTYGVMSRSSRTISVPA